MFLLSFALIGNRCIRTFQLQQSDYTDREIYQPPGVWLLLPYHQRQVPPQSVLQLSWCGFSDRIPVGLFGLVFLATECTAVVWILLSVAAPRLCSITYWRPSPSVWRQSYHIQPRKCIGISRSKNVGVSIGSGREQSSCVHASIMRNQIFLLLVLLFKRCSGELPVQDQVGLYKPEVAASRPEGSV